MERNSRKIRCLTWLAGGGVLLLAVLVQGQKIQDFRVPEYGPDKKLKSVLLGHQALRQSGGLVQIQGLRLETYRADGELDLVVTAPGCLYDPQTGRAWSPGALNAQTADGLLKVSGQGFRWERASGKLVLSNQVVTLISRELIQPSGGTQKPVESGKTKDKP